MERPRLVKAGSRWIARRWRTFPFHRRSSPEDSSTRFSPHLLPSSSCPDVSSEMITEASMPSTSEGRVPSISPRPDVSGTMITEASKPSTSEGRVPSTSPRPDVSGTMITEASMPSTSEGRVPSISPRPDVSGTMITEASMPSTSEGRVPSTRRKRSAEMDVETTEPTNTTPPKKRKFKTNRKPSEDEIPEEMESCPKEGSDDSIYHTCQPVLPENFVTMKQQLASGNLGFEGNPRNMELRPDVLQKFVDKYDIFKVLEEGEWAYVLTGARLQDQLPVAIKVMKKEHVLFVTEVVNGEPRKTPMEVLMLTQVGAGLGSAGSTITPLLLDWYDVGNEVILVLERPEPCIDLLDFMQLYHKRGLPSEIAKGVFRQLVEAASEMQARRVFHRDIKPENILIEDNDVIPTARFIDFGSATSFRPGDIFTGPQGTVRYSTPEWFRENQYEVGPTTMWQLGRVLYFMLFKTSVLNQEQSIASFRQVPIPKNCPEDLKDLLRGCLAKDPAERYTLEMVLNHPWMNS